MTFFGRGFQLAVRVVHAYRSTCSSAALSARLHCCAERSIERAKELRFDAKYEVRYSCNGLSHIRAIL